MPGPFFGARLLVKAIGRVMLLLLKRLWAISKPKASKQPTFAGAGCRVLRAVNNGTWTTLFHDESMSILG